MLGSVSCALSAYPDLACWLYDHAAAIGVAVATSPLWVTALVWWHEARTSR